MKLKRRHFLIASTFFGVSSYMNAQDVNAFKKEYRKVKPLIEAVQHHMFPAFSKIPSAKSMHAVLFLFETMTHKSFDKDIRAFVLEGAEELMRREKSFLRMSSKEKETALRKYERTSYGSAWLSRIMTITMEGMFGDPIYGSNVKEAGWKALNAYAGLPRPRKRYLDV